MQKEVITTDKAALPVGPYSQAIKTGDLIFVAGEKGIDPGTGVIVRRWRNRGGNPADAG